MVFLPWQQCMLAITISEIFLTIFFSFDKFVNLYNQGYIRTPIQKEIISQTDHRVSLPF